MCYLQLHNSPACWKLLFTSARTEGLREGPQLPCLRCSSCLTWGSWKFLGLRLVTFGCFGSRWNTTGFSRAQLVCPILGCLHKDEMKQALGCVCVFLQAHSEHWIRQTQTWQHGALNLTKFSYRPSVRDFHGASKINKYNTNCFSCVTLTSSSGPLSAAFRHSEKGPKLAWLS